MPNIKKSYRYLIVAAILLGLAILIFEFAGIRSELWPGQDKIDKETRDLKQAQATLQKELDESASLQYRRDCFSVRSKDYWIPQRDGKAETEVHKIITQAAKTAGFRLASTGDIRQTKISDGIFSMEIQLSASDSMESFARFCAEIYRSNPKFYWQRCQVRPENMKDVKNVNINGNLKFLCITDEKTASFLLASTGTLRELGK